MTCTKCGSERLDVKYIPEGESVRESSIVPTQSKYFEELRPSDPRTLHSEAIKEHLFITCKTCGYAWAQDTNDAGRSDP